MARALFRAADAIRMGDPHARAGGRYERANEDRRVYGTKHEELVPAEITVHCGCGRALFDLWPTKARQRPAVRYRWLPDANGEPSYRLQVLCSCGKPPATVSVAKLLHRFHGMPRRKGKVRVSVTGDLL